MGPARAAFGATAALSCLLGLAVARECAGPLLVESRRDLETLQSCDVVQGDVLIDGLPTAELIAVLAQPTLDLGDLTTVEGDLTFVGVAPDRADGEVLTVLASNLANVTGKLSFTQMQDFEMPKFPILISAREIYFAHIGFAQGTDLEPAVFSDPTQTESITFSNTTITAINQQWTEGNGYGAFALIVVGNPSLTEVIIPGRSESVVNVEIAGNAASPRVVLSDVTKCTLNLESVSSFTAPSLQQIGLDSLGAPVGSNITVKNTRRQSKTELDLLMGYSAGRIAGNSFPELNLSSLSTIVGRLEISNNSALEAIYFPSLSNVYGEIAISGDVTSIGFGPIDNEGLENGQISVTSPNCDNLQLDLTNYRCASTAGPVSNQQGDGEGDDNGLGNDDDDEDQDEESDGGRGAFPTAAKAGVGVGVGLGVPLLLILAFFLYRRRSRRNRSSRPTRSMGDTAYSKEHVSAESATPPTRYSKVPTEMRTEEVQRPVSSLLSNHASDERDVGHERGQSVGSARAMELEEQQGERFEMEEQQGLRHEMDARSLPDIDLDDEADERRSLEDIERSRVHEPTSHGPVSPVG